jgi:hypothetical protein
MVTRSHDLTWEGIVRAGAIGLDLQNGIDNRRVFAIPVHHRFASVS